MFVIFTNQSCRKLDRNESIPFEIATFTVFFDCDPYVPYYYSGILVAKLEILFLRCVVEEKKEVDSIDANLPGKIVSYRSSHLHIKLQDLLTSPSL